MHTYVQMVSKIVSKNDQEIPQSKTRIQRSGLNGKNMNKCQKLPLPFLQSRAMHALVNYRIDPYFLPGFFFHNTFWTEQYWEC